MTWRRIQERAAAQPAATAIALYAVVAHRRVLSPPTSAIFSQFAPYDDEGTLLITLKAFVHGDALYKEIWSVYGPFYYELFGGFFKLFGLSVTTDASRTIVLVIWVGTSLLFGVVGAAAHRPPLARPDRDDRRLLRPRRAGQRADAPAGPLRAAPRRVLLLRGRAACAARIGWSGLACGALLAALVLTKVNLGIFAVAATVVALAVSVEPIYRRRWLRWLADRRLPGHAGVGPRATT